jgi:hypothetical protein
MSMTSAAQAVCLFPSGSEWFQTNRYTNTAALS